MKAVGRQRGHLVLSSHPSLGVFAIGGQDDQWLRTEAAEFPGLGYGPIREAVLIEEAAHFLPGGGSCTRIVSVPGR